MTVRWQITEEVFHQALALPPDRRTSYLAQACAGDEALRAEVESLLRYASESGGHLQNLVDDAARGLHASLPFVEGARVGPYVIQRELGRGGMGTVYLAARADGQFEQTVALKVINTGIDSGFALGHFLNERQVLANLQHPNIARLLDGGTTESGQPYFAMEYLEGEPMAAHFGRRQTGLAERLRIFKQVCSAIHYAHQQLIVHRDLKPDNILVTKDGSAKLLDFGISKLMGEESAGERIMTPCYASPEQFRGEAPSTACDIYSLGALLYEIVSGQPPFDFRGKTPEQIERMTCEEYPAQLAGELGYVARKAMDKDPARRYSSAEALGSDLSRYTGKYPVGAHPGGSLYRVRKFLVRNHTYVVLASVLLVLILTATAMALHEANLAWRRAGQVRDLADSLLASYNESSDQPESTAQRAERVRRALDSLGQLSAGTGKDSALDLKIAVAYERVGDAQGDPTHRSLGDSRGAENSYRSAIAVLERLFEGCQQLPESQKELFRAEYKLAVLLRATGGAKDSLGHFVRATRLADSSVAASPHDLDLQNETAVIREAMSRVLVSLGQSEKAAAVNRVALDSFEKLTKADPTNVAFWNGLANCYVELAALDKDAGNLRASLEDARKNLEIREAQSAKLPGSPSQQRDLMLAYGHMGDILGYPAMPNLGDRQGAIAYYRKCLAVAQRIAGADPTDQTARADVAMAQLRLASTLQSARAHDEALQILRAGSAETERLLAADPQNKRYLGNAISFRQLIGDEMRRAGESAQAVGNYERALEIADRMRARDPSDGGNWLGVSTDTLIAYSGMIGDLKDRTRAEAVEKRMIEMAGRAKQFHSSIGQAQAPQLYAALGQMRLALGDVDAARSWFQASSAAWQTLQSNQKLHPMYAKEPSRVAALIAGLPR